MLAPNGNILTPPTFLHQKVPAAILERVSEER
jgi:hypothetical protein